MVFLKALLTAFMYWFHFFLKVELVQPIPKVRKQAITTMETLTETCISYLSS